MFNESYSQAVTVTPHDTNQIQDGAGNPVFSRAIKVAVAGNVVIKNKAGVTSTFTLAAGVLYPIQAKVITTASTATGIQAWF